MMGELGSFDVVPGRIADRACVSSATLALLLDQRSTWIVGKGTFSKRDGAARGADGLAMVEARRVEVPGSLESSCLAAPAAAGWSVRASCINVNTCELCSRLYTHGFRHARPMLIRTTRRTWGWNRKCFTMLHQDTRWRLRMSAVAIHVRGGRIKVPLKT